MNDYEKMRKSEEYDEDVSLVFNEQELYSIGENFKQNYFDFYDDVKSHTKGPEDW